MSEEPEVIPPEADCLVAITTPAGPFSHPFPAETSVADVIRATRLVLGIEEGHGWQLLHNGAPLAPEATLVGAGLGVAASLVMEALPPPEPEE